MRRWRIKGLLLLASALVATGLAASTAGAVTALPADPGALVGLCSTATAARLP